MPRIGRIEFGSFRARKVMVIGWFPTNEALKGLRIYRVPSTSRMQVTGKFRLGLTEAMSHLAGRSSGMLMRNLD